MSVHVIVCPSVRRRTTRDRVGSRVVDNTFFDLAIAQVTERLGRVVLVNEEDEKKLPVVQFTLKHDVLPLVSSGIAFASRDEKRYINRLFRGRVIACLPRKDACPAREVEADVMSLDDYRKHVLGDLKAGEAPTEADLEGVTHVISDFHIKAGPLTTSRLPDERALVTDLARQYKRPADRDELEQILETAWRLKVIGDDFSLVAD